MKFCSKCGKRYEDSAKFCKDCGIELTQMENSAANNITTDEIKENAQKAATAIAEKAKETFTEENIAKAKETMNTVKEDIISGNIKTYPKKKLAIGGIAIIAILFLIFNIFSGGDKAGAEKAAQNSAQALITAIEHDTNENLKKFVLTCEPAQQKDKNSGVWNMVNGISRARGTNDYDHSIGKPEKVTIKGDTAEVVIPYTKQHKANVSSSSNTHVKMTFVMKKIDGTWYTSDIGMQEVRK